MQSCATLGRYTLVQHDRWPRAPNPIDAWIVDGAAVGRGLEVRERFGRLGLRRARAERE